MLPEASGEDSGEQEGIDLRRQREQATMAIREIGPAALPYALQLCAKKDSARKEKLVELAGKQTIIKFHVTSEDQYHRMAVEIFRALGTTAKPAIPSLIGLLREKDPGVFYAASDVLDRQPATE
jgi:hypothetical protein